MKTSNSHTYDTRTHTKGFTIVELVVAITISAIIIVSLVSFIITLTNQYAVSSVKSKMTNTLTSASSRISRDVQTSTAILDDNDVSDAAAPTTPDGDWHSTGSQLVLATTARKTDGESLDGTYPGDSDNIVYYVRNGALYRRLLAFNSTSNRYDTITCTAESGGGCEGDTKIADNVSAFAITYYDEDGDEASLASAAASIAVSITLSAEQSGQTITSNSDFTATLLDL